MGSPLIGWARRLPQKALDTVTAPVNAFEGRFPELAGMLGLHPEQEPRGQQADPGMVRAANQSFVDAMNRKRAPERAANVSTQPYRGFSANPSDDPAGFGDKNLDVMMLNDSRNLSGIQGYPSNDAYMRLVGDAGIERQQNRMRAPTFSGGMSPWGTEYKQQRGK